MDLQIIMVKLLISHLDFKFALKLESYISLDWKIQCSPTDASRFGHATLQYLDYEGDNTWL